MRELRLILQIALPLIMLGLGGWAAYWILSNEQQPIVRPPSNEGPLVRVVAVAPSSQQLDVIARGTVEPLRTVELAAEVGGRIIATHEALRAGGAFTPNDVLVEIDAADYRLAITQQEAMVARAELRLLQEQAEAEAAERAWRQLEGDRPADPLVRREPQIRDARLAVEAAKAQLERTRLDLARTRITLPFTGRVREVVADIGQTVQRGQRLAVVLDTSALEVRLPIPVADAAFVDLPLEGATDDGPAVVLQADFAGRSQTWRGRIVRTEGELDRRTRQLTVIARVQPDGGDNGDGSVPLLVGMFVEARITGHTVDDVFVVPRAALHADGHVWVVEPKPTADPPTGDDATATIAARLRRRDVEIVRSGQQHVIVRSGLTTGDLICLSTLEAAVDGMAVRLLADREEEPR